MNARIIILTLLCLILVAPAALRAQDTQQHPYSTPADSVELVIDEGAPISKLLESAREMFIADNYALSEMLYKGVLIREPNNLSAMLE